MTWNAGASNGGSVILDYRISIAELGGIFSVVDSTADSSYLITGLTPGTTYEFKVEARNQYDYSTYSDTLTLLAAYIPDVPTDLTTTLIGQ